MYELPLEVLVGPLLPFPAWGPGTDPRVREWSEVIDIEEFVAAAASALGRLDKYGFVLLPRDSWEFDSQVVVLGTLREDAAVLVGAVAGWMFIDLLGGPFSEVSVASMIRSALRTPIAKFGSFPLPAGQVTLANVIDVHLGSFIDVAHTFLVQSPVDVEALDASLSDAVRELRRPLLVAHLERKVIRGRATSRNSAVVDSLEWLGELRALSRAEERWLTEARAAVAAEPPPLTRRGDESDREWLARCTAHVRATHEAANRAGETRGSGTGGEDWEDAYRIFRTAVGLMYADDFMERIERLRQGDSAQVDFAIEFLEADPWCFRSGYVKQRLLEILPRHSFDELQLTRLEAVLLSVVDVGDRREFRAACRLARRLQSQRVRRGLHDRLVAGNDGVARRSLWMLMGMRRPRLSPVEVEVVQALIFDQAADVGRWWRIRPWVKELMASIETDTWGRLIIDGAVRERDPRCLRLIGLLRAARPNDEEAETLAQLVIEEVATGEDGCTWLERAAPLARADGYLDGLERLRMSPDPDIATRAWWAIRAIQNST